MRLLNDSVGSPMLRRIILVVAAMTPAHSHAAGQSSARVSLAQPVDSIAKQVLQSTGVPGATVAIVRNGSIAYANAYGDAKLEPRLPATPNLRYAIGSISKQFTAVAALLLQQD